MEKTNFDFLCEDLKFSGFGDNLKNALQEAMSTHGIAFELYFSGEMEGEPIHAILEFNKPDPAGYFFFIGFQLALGEKLHHFKIFKGKGVTLKEGFNLLCGRAVFKQLIGKNGQKYNAWIQLDLNEHEGENFKVNTYHESYGYDLSTALDQFVIETPSSNWDRSMLLRSLERGNLQAAFLRENGAAKKVMIEANPKEKTITIRDSLLLAETKPDTEKPADTAHPETDSVENVLKNARRKKLNRK